MYGVSVSWLVSACPASLDAVAIFPGEVGVGLWSEGLCNPDVGWLRGGFQGSWLGQAPGIVGLTGELVEQSVDCATDEVFGLASMGPQEVLNGLASGRPPAVRSSEGVSGTFRARRTAHAAGSTLAARFGTCAVRGGCITTWQSRPVPAAARDACRRTWMR